MDEERFREIESQQLLVASVDVGLHQVSSLRYQTGEVEEWRGVGEQVDQQLAEPFEDDLDRDVEE